MSDGIDGSLLYEHDISMNFGLCRWAQYINVLSDETTCDPGSIIAMAGMLGYKACGVEIWESDVAVKPVVHVGRGYGCGKVNSKGDEMFDQETGQRLDQFSDTQASANATAMEHFWYTLNSHTHAAPDGEAEYSAEAGAAAHAVGRVTCQPDGFNLDGERVEFTKGFFHKKRSDSITTEKQFYREAINKIADTQCITNDANENRPTGGLRIETSRFPTVLGETNMNPEGGFCDMPTQFLGTVKVGGLHRTPRWISITETSFKKKTPYNKNQPCKQMIPLYIPWENSRMGDLELPSSPALTAFQNIAWVGHDSTDSPWDSCEVGCAIPILETHFAMVNPKMNLLQTTTVVWPTTITLRGIATKAQFTITLLQGRGNCAVLQGRCQMTMPLVLNSAGTACTPNVTRGTASGLMKAKFALVHLLMQSIAAVQ